MNKSRVSAMVLNWSLPILLGAPLLPGASAPIPSQTSSAELTLAVMILDQPPSAGVLRLWIVVRNSATIPRIFCRESWGYSWISSDPNGPGVSESKGSLHGCGDDDHDAFWLLLPGERRFDSFEAKAPGLPGNYELHVDVDLVEKPLGSTTAARRTLSWSGRMSDAVALGESLKAGRLPK